MGRYDRRYWDGSTWTGNILYKGDTGFDPEPVVTGWVSRLSKRMDDVDDNTNGWKKGVLIAGTIVLVLAAFAAFLFVLNVLLPEPPGPEGDPCVEYDMERGETKMIDGEKFFCQ